MKKVTVFEHVTDLGIARGDMEREDNYLGVKTFYERYRLEISSSGSHHGDRGA